MMKMDIKAFKRISNTFYSTFTMQLVGNCRRLRIFPKKRKRKAKEDGDKKTIV